MDRATERATEEELDQIYNTLEDGDVEQALGEAETLANRYPRDPDSHLALAAARFESDLPRLALETVVKARALGVEDEALALGLEGSAHYELAEFEMARDCFEQLLRLEPERADAWIDLACAAEHLGDAETAERADRKAAELDPESYSVPLRVTQEQFDEYLHQAIEALPDEFQEQLEEVPIVVQPLPGRDMMGEGGISPDTLGLFVGQNLNERSVMRTPETPEAFFLFQRNLERISMDEEDLVEQIHITLYHELGHLLGWEEEDMEEHGLQ
jgi:predicted Zn-dependent protease with MMP-like domain